MTQFVGNPIRFAATPAVHAEGNPVVFRSPKVWFVRAADGVVAPVELGHAVDGEVAFFGPRRDPT